MDKQKKLCFIAILIAFMAFAYSTTISSINGTNGTNGVSSDTVVYYLHTGGVMNLTTNFTSPGNSITITAVNGFTLIGNWTTPNLSMTMIPAGEHQLHYHAFKTSTGGSHVDNIVYHCFLLYNNGTVKQDHGFSEQQSLTTATENEGDLDLPMDAISVNSTDKWRISVYINQTGSGSNPNIRFDFDDQTDAAFRLPRLVEDNDTAYVNKSGDILTGALTGSFSNQSSSMDISLGTVDLSSQNTTRASSIRVSPLGIEMDTGDGAPHGMDILENQINVDSQINMSDKNITDTNTLTINNGITMMSPFTSSGNETYDFNSCTVGTVPVGWVEDSPHGLFRCISGGQVEMIHNATDATTNNNYHIAQSVTTDDNFTIQFNFSSRRADDYSYYQFNNVQTSASLAGIYLSKHTGNLYYYSGGWNLLQAITVNQTYTLKVNDTKLSAQTFDIYVDGVKKGNDLAFAAASCSISYVHLQGGGGSDAHEYFDDIFIGTGNDIPAETWCVKVAGNGTLYTTSGAC